MTTDLVARLYLQSEGFDKSVEAAKKSVDNFKKSTSQAGKEVKTMQSQVDVSIPGFDKFKNKLSSITGGVGKFAASFGIAMGAMEVYNKFINSNATLQQQYNSYMEAGSTVVDQFFSALYNGDWSVFNNGIDTAISKAQRFSNTYKDLQRLLVANQLRFDRQDARKDQLEAIIEDESKPLEERKKAQAELDRMLLMMIADIRQASTKTTESLYNLFEGLAGGMNWQQFGDPRKLAEDLINPYSGLRGRLSTYRDIRDTKNQVINPNAFKYTGKEWAQINREASEKFYKNYSEAERDRYDQLLRLVDALNDETVAKFEELLGNLSQLESYSGMLGKDRTGAREEIQQAQTAPIQKAVAAATTTGVEEGFKKVDVKALEAPMIPALTSLTTDVTNKRVAADIQSGYIDVKGVDTAIKANESYAESLSGVASILGSITNLTQEGAGAWLSYAANVMTAAAQAIPSIKALASAQALQATTGAAASTSSIPIVGWLTAGAAVASVIAAIASTPKFAYGGIVPGSSFTGDNVPALVNSGEMILNRGQQANLFRMIAGGGGRAGNVNVSGEFTVRGRDLVAVISNQQRVDSRVR